MLITSLLSVLAPHECLGCGAEGSLLCAACRSGLRPAVPRCYRCQRFDADFKTCRSCRRESPLYAVVALTRYEALAKNLVWKLKFGRARAAADEMADMLSRLNVTFGKDMIVVAHAPTAASRIRQRGYDQAALIARSLARRRKLRYAPLLARQNSTKQIGASRRARLRQLEQAFRPIRTRKIEGATVLLVDDVVTTGATLTAAASALKAAGAKRVIGVVFAQA